MSSYSVTYKISPTNVIYRLTLEQGWDLLEIYFQSSVISKTKLFPKQSYFQNKIWSQRWTNNARVQQVIAKVRETGFIVDVPKRERVCTVRKSENTVPMAESV